MTPERREMLYSFDYWRRAQLRRELYSDIAHAFMAVGAVFILLVLL